MTKYVRSADGRKVHLSTCRWVSAGHAKWNWAEDRPIWEIQAAAITLKLSPCKTCKPFVA